MTREYAVKVVKALNDIEDFEILFDEIEDVMKCAEGDFDDFFQNQLTPLLSGELIRRNKILEDL